MLPMLPTTPLVSFHECPAQDQIKRVDEILKRIESSHNPPDVAQVHLAQQHLKKIMEEHFAVYARNMAALQIRNPGTFPPLQTSTWTVGDVQTLREMPKKKKRKNAVVVAANGAIAGTPADEKKDGGEAEDVPKKKVKKKMVKMGAGGEKGEIK